MHNLTIYKASAGSGKTFRLTLEYIKKILINPYEYRHILAITFTNKATNEMKSRILDVLFNIATGNETSGYLDKLHTELPQNIEIKTQASKALKLILNDFSYFNVSTIDSFFQRVLKSFIRELNLRFDFALELNTDNIKEDVYTRIIDRIAENKQLRHWIIKLMNQNLDNENSWNIKNKLQELTGDVFKEFFVQQKDKISFTFDELLSKKKAFEIILETHFKQLRAFGESFTELMTSLSLEYTDFYRARSGVGIFFKKLKEFDGNIKNININSYVQSTYSEGKWFTKQPGHISMSSINKFQQILNNTIQYLDENLPLMKGIAAVNNQFYYQGILTIISDMVKEYANENNLFFLPQSGLLIRNIIGDSPQPIIYEKIGNYFNHIMLDEFQDTSNLQYANFKPLMEEIISSEKNSALVVGDIKQSIYRWRNANWEIMKNNIPNDFPHQITEKNLIENFRSAKEIVNFNNVFFQSAANLFDIKNNTTEFSEIYPVKHEKFQQYRKEFSGYVSICGLENTEFKANAMGKTIAFIKELQNNNYNAGDIAILSRTRKDVQLIANRLLEEQTNHESSYNFKFVSNEALLLNASPAVNLVVQVLIFLLQPENNLIFVQIKKYYSDLFSDNHSPDWWLNNVELSQKIIALINEIQSKRAILSLFELCQDITELFNLISEKTEPHLLFVKGFLDIVFDFENKHGNHISDFLMWWKVNNENFKVNLSSDTDAIQLLTIHKSKGLQFPIVIIPFCDWKIMKNETMWVTNECEPFNGKYFLVSTSEIEKSIFDNDFQKEKLYTDIDSLNMLYVAFTRPERILKAFYNAEAKTNYFSHYIKQVLHAIDCENENFESGALTTNTTKPKSEEETMFLKINSNSGKHFLYPYLNLDTFYNHAQQQGEKIHWILQKIKYQSDVKIIINQFMVSDPENTIILKEFFDEGLKHSEFVNWFSDKWQIYNEREFLDSLGNIIRIDRLLIYENTAIIIDYKTGKEEPEHKLQVSHYTETLKQLGYNIAKGYLLYLSPFKIVEVD